MYVEKPRIGVVGVGRMGANIARHLKDIGYSVAVVHDVNLEAKTAVASELGAHAASTLTEVTDRADVVITVVSDDAAMDAIYAEEGDSLLGGPRGSSSSNTATVTPAVHVEVERRVEARGGQSVEDCMASSVPEARTVHSTLWWEGRRMPSGGRNRFLIRT